jgi:hypothetical protein
LQDHKNYNKETGNIDLDTAKGTVTYDASSLWRLEDPKAYMQVGDPLTVPSGGRLVEIRKINGLSQITSGEELRMEQNAAGGTRLRYKNQTIKLTPEEAQLFQARDLSATQRIQSGQDPVVWTGRGELVVFPENLDAIRAISGLSNVTSGNRIAVDEDKLGNFRARMGPVTIALTDEQAALFQTRPLDEVQQIKAGQTLVKFTEIGRLIMPAGKTDLIMGSKVGDVIIIERNQRGDVQYTYKGEPLAKAVAVQLQASPVSQVDKVKAGLVIEPREAFVNTGKTYVVIAGKSVGPGQTGYFTKTDMNSEAFRGAQGQLRTVGDVSTDSKPYMFKEPQTIDKVEYVPGDVRRYTPQEFDLLSEELQKSLTDDTALRATTLKKNYFKSIWGNVTRINGLTLRAPKEEELQTLLGMFPAGMRSGGKTLRDEVFNMIKLGATANPNTSVLPATAAAYVAEETYAQSVETQLAAAEQRYNEYLSKGVIPEVPWQSLSFEKKRAFADMRKVIQITNANLLWQKAQDRLAKDKASFKPMGHDDVASFSSATELLILAKHLRDGQELDKSGRFFVGTLSKLGAGIFADVEPLTSGASRRLQQIINRMKASYATLSAVEGGGRDSVFRQQLQAALVPEFIKAESMNRANLDSMINRLETNMRSVFNKETQSTNTIPKIFEIMAKDAGITGVSVDQKRYRWLDPNLQETPAVTRQRVMASINMEPYSIVDAQDLRVGRLLPPSRNAPGVRYVKIKNLPNGEVLVQEAGNDGKPKPNAPKRILGTDLETRLQ